MEEVSDNKGKLFMVLAAFLTATGQLFWKLGYNHFAFMLVGFICYGGGSLFMIKALAQEKLSVAYPIMCTGYIFALIYGVYILDESITFTKVIAVLLLMLGVTFTTYDK